MDKKTQKEILEIVEKNYRQIADQYAETRNRQMEPLWSNLLQITKPVKDGAKILDVGCGSARLLDAFENKKIKYLGVDFCEELLKHAEKKAKKSLPGAKFKASNLLTLGQLPEIGFDYVFCVAVLHHIPGKELRVQALKQLRNKINKEGKIIITAWNMWEQNKFIKLILKFFALKLLKKNQMDFGDIFFDWKNPQNQTTSKRYYHAFTKGQLKKLAKLADLKIEKIFSDKFNYYLILTK